MSSDSSRPTQHPRSSRGAANEHATSPLRPPSVSQLQGAGWIPALGSLFAGTYRIQRMLGEGAMGVVLLARDVRLEREVAIKLIHPDYVASPESHQRFLEEARAMARVRHENVVEIFNFDEYNGSPYFIMEYVPGQHVEAWMENTKERPSIDEAIGIIDQVCRGVAAIHKAGAVHRDLKWTNVLLGPAFRVCVADLGLARILDKPRRESLDTVSGTPAYMAPEVVVGADVPPGMHGRADVYSLAVMAFELLTGRLPYVTDDAVEMMTAHVEGTVPLPSELRDELHPAFDQVLMRALEKDPAKRTATPEIFRRELQTARQSVSQPVQRGLRFLVADDDEDFSALVSAVLSSTFKGAEITAVGDGSEALRQVELKPHALAVIDLDMPGMNGIELTAAIRATPSAEKMPILVATATGGAPDWKLLQALGADGFVVKPIDPMALVALVRRTIERGKS